MAARKANRDVVSPGPAPAVVMVRPHAFRVNPETACDNGFQQDGKVDAAAAYGEVTALAEALSRSGVRVLMFEDAGEGTPDSVFPNNWFSTHADGTLVLYPMRAINRRAERREDILAALQRDYAVTRRVDLSVFEDEGRFLEGTGSLVLDRKRRIAFACRSPRTDEELLRSFCEKLGYEPHLFDARTRDGQSVYHTNVVLTLGGGFAMVGMELVADEDQRDRLRTALEDKALVELSYRQIGDFAGNALELQGSDGPLLAMSARAADTLTARQRMLVEGHARILDVSVPTIERAGGSVRCMLAPIYLPLEKNRLSSI